MPDEQVVSSINLLTLEQDVLDGYWHSKSRLRFLYL